MDDSGASGTTTNTSQHGAGSTSSTTKAGSPRDALHLLGEQILAEIDDPHTANTSTRWLAHHLSGLMHAADTAQAEGAADADTKASSAREAVMDLWQHRSSWPHGWPPPGAARVISALDSLGDPLDPVWPTGGAVARLHELHHQMLAVLLDLAAGSEAAIEQGWLDTFGEHLTPTEVAILTRVADAPSRTAVASGYWLPAIAKLQAEMMAGAEAEDRPDALTWNDANIPDEPHPSSPLEVVSVLARIYQQTLDTLTADAGRGRSS